MKIPRPLFKWSTRCGTALLCVAGALSVGAQSLITSVVETGGDNEATDTITAKWTGVTWNTTVANEPILNTPVGTPYTVPLFGPGVPCFVDRAHTHVAATPDLPIPDYLLGGEYIMSGNDNRDNASYELAITVSDAAVVYMLIDNRLPDGVNTTPPNYNYGIDPVDWTVEMAWMGTEGFKPVLNGLNRTSDPTWPDEIGVDEGADGSVNQYYSIYSKVVPAGTFRIYQADNAGRNMYAVVLKRVPNSVNNPPEIKDRTPRNDAMFYAPGGGISFTATTVSPNTISASGITLALNGVDVSSALTIGGSATSRTVAYAGLQPNQLYRARIVVADQEGRATTNTFAFDTFTEATSIAVEAEDYNYDNGKFMSPATPGAYTGLLGVRGVDFHNNNQTALAAAYRNGDFVLQAVTADQVRKSFSDVGAIDHHVTTIMAGDWWNYTRTLPEGNYRVYLRGATTVVQGFQLDLVTTGATTANQTTRLLGTFTLGQAGGGFGYGSLGDAAGNGVVLRLPANPTLRLTALGAAGNVQLNYVLLVPTTENPGMPYLASATPAPGAVNVAPDAAVQLQLLNGGTAVDAANVSLQFGGTDVTASLVKVPSADGLSVTYDPPGLLAFGTNYAVKLTFSDAGGTAVTHEWTFATVGSLTVIPGNFATPPGSGVGSGLNFKIRKAPNYSLAGALTLANTAARANQQLADQLIDPDTGEPYVNEAAGPNNNGLGTTSMVNYNQTGPSAGFMANDEFFPYIDVGWDPDPNNIAMEFTAYVDLPEGIHRFGVRSDDGFQLACGPTFAPVDATLVLGQFEGGRGDGLPGGETTFDFMVEVAGVYAIRMIYYEGNGGANVELYSIDRQTFKRTLLNSPEAGAVKAYTSRSTQVFVPTVAITGPANGAQYPTAPTNVVVTASAAVTGGQIAKVEFFDGAGTLLGESTGAPYSFAWNNLSAGRHTVWARATDTKGISKDSERVSFQVALLVQVNFQNTSVMEPPAGYLPDYGYAYVDDAYFSQYGYHYGWDADNTAHARNRNNPASPDERYDTFNHSQKPQPAGTFWEIEIPNGRYNVFVVAGESDNFDSVFDVVAEGVTIVKGTADTNVRWYEGMAAVNLTDGRLTLGNGPTASNNKFTFIEIYTLPAQAPTPVLNPPTLTGDTLTVTWTGGRLEEAADLNGQWTAVPGNPQGTYTVPVSAAPRKFYRVVAP